MAKADTLDGVDPMNQYVQVTGLKPGTTRYPRYDAAALGFEKYWYPVMLSRQLKEGKPAALTLFGQRIMFYRDRGRAFALQDRCPHRGVRISVGKQEFPGTWSCRYHGWTFDLKSGKVVAALTDGPDSKVCGNAGVRVYPVEERGGMIWVYNGTDTPPPVEDDIPSELLREDAVSEWRFTERPGDWRHAAENGFDEGHGKYLHRDSWYASFLQLPGWIHSDVIHEPEGWLTRQGSAIGYQGDFPGLGKWPKLHGWKTQKVLSRASIRMPCTLRIHLGEYVHFEWYIPTSTGHHRYIQAVVKFTKGVDALLFRLRYWAYIRWIFHVEFNNQDASMVEMMETPPEILYRPDLSIIGWRRLCENARGAESTDPREKDVSGFSNQQQSAAKS
jgi:phenylpropionate dioxygenase-like ring-hydroxylating dioxygenase large terminal subunit